jgi:predicted metal-dependent hydrolase
VSFVSETDDVPQALIDEPIDPPAEYLRYFELFNAGDFFEAHEVLEDLWVVEVGEVRNYYKGLIMVAVAVLHWQRGNLAGARRLYRDGTAYLRAYPATYEGFELGRFLKDMGQLFQPLGLEGPAPAPDPALIPRIGLAGPR